MTDNLRDGIQLALGAQFVLGRELGGGGMSRVFLARDVQLGREVVVKVLSPELAQELSVERFGREIALAAALQHANIVPVLSAGVSADGLPYYLMPFVEGASLRDMVSGGTSLPIADVLLVLNDVARALAYAHTRGVVHRDIKPDNVMLSGGAALVTDFGIAKAMSSARTSARATAETDSLTRMGTSIGTPSYMAPEQGAGDPDTDHRADLYAYGAMAYELLTGAPPFGDRPPHALLIAHLAEAPKPVGTIRTDTPEPLAQLVMRCLEKNPADRPQSASELLESLADASSALRAGTTGQYGTSNKVNETAAPIAGASAPSRSRKGVRTGIMVAGALAIAAAAGAWFAFGKSNGATGPDAASLAVMPFTVRDASLDVWREGLVDILSRSLDGAGDIRTVPPSASIANAPARADAATATTHGKSLGAGLVLFGDLNAVGPDSVRVRAAVVDVSTGKVRHDIDVSGELSRMDALADTLSLRVIQALGSGGELAGGARIASIGTSSLTALKSYLHGVQLYRRGVTDSSLAAFESAVAADSTFSLAWRGVASIYIRTGRESMPEAQAALDRAIRFKAGRGPRDSLLLLGDSLRLAVVRRDVVNDAVAEIPAVTRLIATLREATQRYPRDAELWLEYGDAAYHFGQLAGVSDTVSLQAFTNAIALDTNVLVPYVHATNLALRMSQYREAAQYSRAAARLLSGQTAVYYQMRTAILDSAPRVSAAARAMVDTSPVAYVSSVIGELMAIPEVAPLLSALSRSQAERLSGKNAPSDSAELKLPLLYARAWSGNLDAGAAAALRFTDRTQLADAGLLPVAPVLAEARTLLQRQPAAAVAVLSLAAASRDTALLAQLVVALDSLDAAARATTPSRVPRTADLARAMQSLARGDSAAALRGLLAVPMKECGGAPCSGYTSARLLVASARDAEAARLLDRWLPVASLTLSAPRAMLLRAELAEKVGDKATAALWYGRVVARWGSGDDVVKSMLASAREGLKRTTG